MAAWDGRVGEKEEGLETGVGVSSQKKIMINIINAKSEGLMDSNEKNSRISAIYPSNLQHYIKYNSCILEFRLYNTTFVLYSSDYTTQQWYSRVQIIQYNSYILWFKLYNTTEL